MSPRLLGKNIVDPKVTRVTKDHPCSVVIRDQNPKTFFLYFTTYGRSGGKKIRGTNMEKYVSFVMFVSRFVGEIFVY